MSWTREQRNVTIAAYLGWTLDAFDFFLMVFVLKDIAAEFNTKIPAVAFGITLTLMMRPVGALIFGWLADKFGRRPTLMVNIACYLPARIAVRLLAQPDHAARAARAVRHRDGRRMGRRRRTDHGNRAAQIARHRLRSAASRLSERLSARLGRVRRASISTSAGAACSSSACCRRCWCCTCARMCRSRPPSRRSKRRASGLRRHAEAEHRRCRSTRSS